MRNNTQKAKSLQVNDSATLSHETAQISTSLATPLKGTKNEILKELSSLMHVQASYIISQIEMLGIAEQNSNLQSAINLYLEAQCKHHYVSNDIGN